MGLTAITHNSRIINVWTLENVNWCSFGFETSNALQIIFFFVFSFLLGIQMELPIYLSILSIFNPIFYVFTLVSQSLVIYTILRHSPKNLQTFKLVLINTCVFQIIHATTCFLTQMRQLSDSTPMQLWVYGPARHLDPMIGYCIYHMLQTAAFTSSKSVFITIYLKYEAAKNLIPSKGKIIKVVILLLIPVLTSMVSQFVLCYHARNVYEGNGDHQYH